MSSDERSGIRLLAKNVGIDLKFVCIAQASF